MIPRHGSAAQRSRAVFCTRRTRPFVYFDEVGCPLTADKFSDGGKRERGKKKSRRFLKRKRTAARIPPNNQKERIESGDKAAVKLKKRHKFVYLQKNQAAGVIGRPSKFVNR